VDASGLWPVATIVARPRCSAATVHSWKPGYRKYSIGVRWTLAERVLGSLQTHGRDSRNAIFAPGRTTKVLPESATVIVRGPPATAETTPRAQPTTAKTTALRRIDQLYPHALLRVR
jgi:hypothetical protein